MRHLILSPLNLQVISAINNVDEAKSLDNIQEITFTKGIGDVVTEIHSSIDRCGFVIAQCESAGEAIETCEKAKQIINIVV